MMNVPENELFSAYVDGELTAEQEAQVEQLLATSPDARQLIEELRAISTGLQALPPQRVGEDLSGRVLQAVAERVSRKPVDDPMHDARLALGKLGPRVTFRRTRRSPRLGRPLALFATAAAAAILVMVAGWLTAPDSHQVGPVPSVGPPTRFVARLTGATGAAWSDGSAAAPRGAGLVAGRKLGLRAGLAEVTFTSGARLILQGPAEFEVSSVGGGFLHVGQLTANVPTVAHGFTVHTPNAAVIDLGTEFGVVVEQNGPSEIYVFTGGVEVQIPTATGNGGPGRVVRAGEAVSVPPGAQESLASLQQIDPAGRNFVRELPAYNPPAGSVAELRNLVAGHPRLIHHYTFEGGTQAEKCRDKRGNLHLVEVTMAGGHGDGNLDYSVAGLDSTTNAVRPFRAPLDGNSSGSGLQSKTSFHPPADLTVELLVRFDGMPGEDRAAISAAVATREGKSNCGFIVVTVEEGRLAHLMDAAAPWVHSNLVFLPGQWYYVASTFRMQAGQTVVNSYAANLSQGESVLRHVVRAAVAPGLPAAGRLGIGKAFDSSMADAYPWAGALDEVALYDTILSQKILQRHLDRLLGGR